MAEDQPLLGKKSESPLLKYDSAEGVFSEDLSVIFFFLFKKTNFHSFQPQILIVFCFHNNFQNIIEKPESFGEKLKRIFSRQPVYKARKIVFSNYDQPVINEEYEKESKKKKKTILIFVFSRKYASNSIRNQKYNVFSFVPLVLYHQFRFAIRNFFLLNH